MQQHIPSQDISRLASDIEHSEKKAVATLEQLATLAGARQLFTYLFFWSVAKGSLCSNAQNSSPVEIEHIAFHLVPKFHSSIEDCLNPFIGNKALCAVEALTLARHKKMIYERLSTTVPSIEGEDVQYLALTEATIVRGSAYPQQTANEINDIQGKFDPWFEQRVGISLTRPR